MGGIPPELTSSALTALAILGTWFGTWLARKGKREDTKIAQANLTFTQVLAVADQRLKDIERLDDALVSARAELDRLRESWERRWERQMTRCRKVTDSLIRAIAELQKTAGPTAEATAALQAAEEHYQDDHDTGES